MNLGTERQHATPRPQRPQQQNLLQYLLCICRMQITVEVNVISAAIEAGGRGNPKW